jgi:hypothetical protein
MYLVVVDFVSWNDQLKSAVDPLARASRSHHLTPVLRVWLLHQHIWEIRDLVLVVQQTTLES